MVDLQRDVFRATNPNEARWLVPRTNYPVSFGGAASPAWGTRSTNAGR
jgi:hypothetical protein